MTTAVRLDTYGSPPVPCRPKPLPDELFSSWVLRLALHSGMKPQSFCQMMWPGRPFWNRSLDRSADPAVLESLSLLTATPLSLLRETLLSDYEGVLFRKLVRNGNTPWILPLAIYHRVHLRSGLAFCPLCLADGEAYFRRVWRLSLITVCVQHRCVLLDACSSCSAAIQPHRVDMGNRSPYTNKPLYLCTRCDSDLRETTHGPASGQQMSNQGHILSMLRPCSGQCEAALQYFSVLGHTLRLLATRAERAVPLRELVAGESHSPEILNWRDEVNWLKFDGMGISDRRNFLGAASWLLDEWPERFLRICRTAHLRPSDVMRDFLDTPPWYRTAALTL